MGREKKDVIISLRIPRKLKEEMSKLNVNWSEYIREAIEYKINIEKMKRIWVEIENLKERGI